MKFLCLLTSELAALFLAACATTTPPDNTARQVQETLPPSPEQEENADSGDPEIRVGMTKTQVLRAWGEPSGRDVTARQEIWVYGNQHMKRFIPYAGPFLNVNTRKVLFRNGRVADFRSTDSGNVWSQGEGMGGSGFSGW